jgi:hypothetical protein
VSKLLFMLVICLPLGATTVADRLIHGLSKVEHCVRWNNPGCLKYAKQLGAKRNRRGYAVFVDPYFGYLALRKQVLRRKGRKVGPFLNDYNRGIPGYVEKVLAASGLKYGDRI